MRSGIRVEIRVEGATGCPMVRASDASGEACRLLSRSLPGESEQVLEVFLAAPDVELADVEPVFDYRSKSVYRARRDRDVACPCTQFDRLGYSLDSVRAAAGGLSIVSHVTDMAELQRAVDELRDRYAGVVVQRLVRLDEDRPDRDLAMFDLSELTDRQREVLETAHRMGYFEHPRGANAGEVASELDINRSTFAQHLAAAQRKILDSLLDG